MRFLYGIFIFLYTTAIRAASAFSPKARLWVTGRKKIFLHLEKKINEQDPSGSRRRVWFHCASLGEFEQGRPVIESYRAKYPDDLIVVTFFSPSGYEIRKNYQGADVVLYLPPDSRRNARRFVSLVNPASAVFVKYEFWYNYLYELKKHQTKVLFISVILRPTQVFFKEYGGWFRKQLRSIDHFFVQDEPSRELLISAGCNNVTVSGDTRFDRVAEVSRNPKDLPLVAAFCSGEYVMVAGSTWPEDEKLILPVTAGRKMKVIIAPHETEPSRIRELAGNISGKSILYSDITGGKTPEPDTQYLIIDCIGILSSLYRYGSVAYIGGGFGAGIHNILEAAAFGIPVIFGPNYHKFREATDLIRLGGAFSTESGDQLVRILDKLAQNGRSGAICSGYVSENQGATQCIMQHL